MDKWLNEYSKQFNEEFPLRLFMGVSEEKIIEVIKECLEKKTPYEFEDDGEKDF